MDTVSPDSGCGGSAWKGGVWEQMQRAHSSESRCLRAGKAGEEPGVATAWWVVVSFLSRLLTFHWPGSTTDFLLFMMPVFSTDTISCL